jgi:hypothetical protein
MPRRRERQCAARALVAEHYRRSVLALRAQDAGIQLAHQFRLVVRVDGDLGISGIKYAVPSLFWYPSAWRVDEDCATGKSRT